VQGQQVTRSTGTPRAVVALAHGTDGRPARHTVASLLYSHHTVDTCSLRPEKNVVLPRQVLLHIRF
jgi:hypothetical protein